MKWSRLPVMLRPNASCIVPEKEDELTTEGGLAVRNQQDFLAAQVGELKEEGIGSPYLLMLMKMIY